ncbi:RNA polymerase sigma factor [Clostridium beijerinckii]|uniref:RNA polymerase sigma-70 factor (ECF subfamily) n=1 Tax=Clostridium beijerinckii TaxID=1520 RepID=A0A9Q5CKY4_CLOBE|nr:RNA polymerase sigma factor [Clostridium beijerinckii]AQS06380.1 ECF RNA polymerase sigma factor SigW [Clostridium beijerinckii]MBA2885756.1 RNA polymerase sigma-70 factor (ECF subfamily) [Clostridium beijerinckii]MBA2900543.1 RNA polymerase sigma-70 factor (ECF subfamily) [Clostridium beijerinckii]MBA2910315.1 RNA polymerase sigma-70 factor (ECF subfamily) [Clostridium beijerinckii]MBA9014002.1 RNA polymerase sigma-70 factor (ECF subfamily) [Clostridium beijerinckii]
MSEEELVIEIQSGDMNALGELFEIYKNESFKYSYLITGSKYTSEDIVQEAFISCYKNIKSLKNPEFFKSWFFKMLTRIAWRYAKKDKKSLPVDNIFEKLDEKNIDTSIEQYLRKEQNNNLYAEIEKLDLKQKTVIILYYFNGLTVNEIAKVMGCFEGTVKSRLHSARKKLKSSLIKCDDEYNHRNLKRVGLDG